MIPHPRVELGIADDTTPQDQVAFTVEADLLEGDFFGTIPTAGLTQGSYRVGGQACLGDVCARAQAAPVTLGELVEKRETNLELTVRSRGEDMVLNARLGNSTRRRAPSRDGRSTSTPTAS